jgi:ABC-type phosphate transport system substrate-binding protein
MRHSNPIASKDVARNLTDLEGYAVDLIQVPPAGGSVAVCYNLPGSPALKLSRNAYICMLHGEITYWNDSRVLTTNPGVALPHLEMTVVRRAESGGTTFVFTKHLNAIDPRWTTAKGGPGVGKNVPWPVGIGGKGNADVNARADQRHLRTPAREAHPGLHCRRVQLSAIVGELIGLRFASFAPRGVHESEAEPNTYAEVK